MEEPTGTGERDGERDGEREGERAEAGRQPEERDGSEETAPEARGDGGALRRRDGAEERQGDASGRARRRLPLRMRVRVEATAELSGEERESERESERELSSEWSGGESEEEGAEQDEQQQEEQQQEEQRSEQRSEHPQSAGSMLDVFRSIPTQMDYKGQKLAEQIFQGVILVSAAIGFIYGYITEQFGWTVCIVMAGFALSCLLTLPPWPMYRRNPLKWLPVQESGSEDKKPADRKPKRHSKS
ncbi:signal peptidase complex subunit 1 [Excalfactoria chinensis]|uniref:signal peptidase complex subunit 1 n=1 Tax=Excalfactoria chinensis TaxID=46218 RepID=UPI003B3ABFEE